MCNNTETRDKITIEAEIRAGGEIRLLGSRKSITGIVLTMSQADVATAMRGAFGDRVRVTLEVLPKTPDSEQGRLI